MNVFKRLWNWLTLHPVLGNLTLEEYEEWEFLGQVMDWRCLRPDEKARYRELNKKRGI